MIYLYLYLYPYQDLYLNAVILNLLHYLNMSILCKIQHFANNKQENMQ